ncbi:MAG: DNA-3-methyladenine glycosylase [Planctomycetes bacterium]|nr:DNA-3-methyladenine glycosylase [Planctomycetota bacterium]
MSATSVGLPRAFFERDVVAVARDLLGAVLLRDGVGGRIVETEAYHEREAASHAFVGPTRRNRSLFLRGGHLYVYRIHQVVCANVSCEGAGTGAGVLVRALAPTHGLEQVAARRAGAPRRAWTDGPGKLCRALGITLGDDGQDLVEAAGPVRLVAGPRAPDAAVVAGPRVGISKAVDLPWRFRLVGSGSTISGG